MPKTPDQGRGSGCGPLSPSTLTTKSPKMLVGAHEHKSVYVPTCVLSCFALQPTADVCPALLLALHLHGKEPCTPTAHASAATSLAPPLHTRAQLPTASDPHGQCRCSHQPNTPTAYASAAASSLAPPWPVPIQLPASFGPNQASQWAEPSRLTTAALAARHKNDQAESAWSSSSLTRLRQAHACTAQGVPARSSGGQHLLLPHDHHRHLHQHHHVLEQGRQHLAFSPSCDGAGTLHARRKPGGSPGGSRPRARRR